MTVSATRSSQTIANTPTRVEVISGEELEEKGNVKPGDFRMMLSKSTGIQTQQTSAIENRIGGDLGSLSSLVKTKGQGRPVGRPMISEFIRLPKRIKKPAGGTTGLISSNKNQRFNRYFFEQISKLTIIPIPPPCPGTGKWKH